MLANILAFGDITRQLKDGLEKSECSPGYSVELVCLPLLEISISASTNFKAGTNLQARLTMLGNDRLKVRFLTRNKNGLLLRHQPNHWQYFGSILLALRQCEEIHIHK
jgi:hypothetical protein